MARRQRPRADDRPGRIRVRRPLRSQVVRPLRTSLHKQEGLMTVDVVTFGCRLNACESEIIRRQAEASGLADTVIVNTCAVTAEAVRQAKQTIRRLARERPNARIVVTGCA